MVRKLLLVGECDKKKVETVDIHGFIGLFFSWGGRGVGRKGGGIFVNEKCIELKRRKRVKTKVQAKKVLQQH